jgi:hypothetical protein
MAAEGVPLSTQLDRRIGARRMTASGHHQSFSSIATNFRNGSSTEASGVAQRSAIGAEQTSTRHAINFRKARLADLPAGAI